MSDTATDEQMDIPHAYEDEFARRAAWTFDNVFQSLARGTNSVEEFDAALINHSRTLVNVGDRDRAVAWARFADRKWADIYTGTA